MEKLTLEEKADLALKEAQEAVDYMEIQNLVSAHLYCYRAQKQCFEIEHFWARERDDIAYADTEGREAVVAFYCETNHKMRMSKLELAHKFYPQVEVRPENEGVGDMVAKMSTNPYVEISGDGMSARGVWFSPGICSELGPDGNIKATYFQEKIGLDFVRESEGWKILRLNIFPEVIRPMPAEIFRTPEFSRTFNLLHETEEEKKHAEEGRTPPYGPTTVATWNPPLPEKYETWDDKLSFTGN